MNILTDPVSSTPNSSKLNTKYMYYTQMTSIFNVTLLSFPADH